ncbi:signal peptidase I [Microbacterium sp. Marseille-Q6965]|uniref:signal peptidase I n=1 Tax=Microbacterium sp. Marseille-Q6965 TaxID=2965072 RepID=UPI0021B7416E|nr:signal peptidase I [Microbacterium sp. Marseille-Q6965]
MMQFLRRTALTALWLLAGFGFLCGATSAATSAGLIKPLVVVSGSMEPEIMTGDLLIARKVPTAGLRVGDVVSLPSPLTDDLVTHRIEQITTDGSGGLLLTLKGDNNPFSDAVDYAVSGHVWQPALQLPGWGAAMTRLATPVVAAPLLCGLMGLLGLTLLAPADARPRRAPAGDPEVDAAALPGPSSP